MMPGKTKKQPNVIFATITSEKYNPYQDVYRINAKENGTQNLINDIRARFEYVSPHVGHDIVIWKNIDNIPKYVAYDDVIVMEFNAFDAPGLDKVTQQHFNAYKKKSRARLKIKANVKEIEQDIDNINKINTKHNVVATKAKNELMAFLNDRAEKMRQMLKGKEY